MFSGSGGMTLRNCGVEWGTGKWDGGDLRVLGRRCHQSHAEFSRQYSAHQFHRKSSCQADTKFRIQLKPNGKKRR